MHIPKNIIFYILRLFLNFKYMFQGWQLGIGSSIGLIPGKKLFLLRLIPRIMECIISMINISGYVSNT